MSIMNDRALTSTDFGIFSVDIIDGKRCGYGFNPVIVNQLDYVCIAPYIKKSDEFLMIEQFRYGTERLYVEFPGGLVEKAESPVEAAQRELLEETGCSVNVDDLKFIGKYAINSGMMKNYINVFFVEITNSAKMTSQSLDETEKIIVKKVKKDKLMSIDNDSIFHLAVVSLIMMKSLCEMKGV